MENATSLLDFVNGQTAFHDAKATAWEKKHESARGSRHREFAQRFRELAAELGRLQQIEARSASVREDAPARQTLALAPEDVEGLPV